MNLVVEISNKLTLLPKQSLKQAKQILKSDLEGPLLSIPRELLLSSLKQ